MTPHRGSSQTRRVAVVGSGVAGLTAAWALRDVAEVTLLEADDRLGGHAHTHDLVDSAGSPQAVDSGFIVHNRRTYPVLLRLFDELGVATQDSEMSMSVVCEGCGLQYAGAKGLRGLLAQPRNVLDGRYLRLLAEVLRFHHEARRVLADGRSGGTGEGTTLGQMLRDGGYQPYFVAHFVTPLVSAVWSTPPDKALEYPARYLFEFLSHHGMLSVHGSPRWRTVTGGSRSYVDLLAKNLPVVRTSAPVSDLRRTGSGVELRAGTGVPERFDAAVVATHPASALGLLARPTAAEDRLLGAIGYSSNPTVVHTDPTLLPSRGGAQASWNYRMTSCSAPADEVVVSYDMTRLQRLSTPDRFVVTLGGGDRVDDASVLARTRYEHPTYTPSSVAARSQLHELGDDRLVFAGAYHGWGFHEDGARSGREAARRLGSSW